MSPTGFEGEGSPDRVDALVWALTELMLGDSQDDYEFVMTEQGVMDWVPKAQTPVAPDDAEWLAKLETKPREKTRREQLNEEWQRKWGFI
jgi:hypothetical protein